MEGYNLMTSKYYVLKCKKNMKKNLKHFPVGIISLTLFTSFSKVKLLTGRVFKWSKTKYKAVPCSIFDVTFFSFFLYEITPPYTYVSFLRFLKECNVVVHITISFNDTCIRYLLEVNCNWEKTHREKQ